MSGHSKWSTIKHKKGIADAKKVFYLRNSQEKLLLLLNLETQILN